MSDVSLSPKAVAELRELQAKVGDNLLLAASDFTQKDPQFTDAEADWLAAINNAAPALLALASQSLLPNAELQAGLARAIQEAWHRGAFTAIDLQNGVAIARAIIESGVMPLASQSLEREGDGWQPIETAPKDGTRILVYQFDHGRGGDYYAVIRWFVKERDAYEAIEGFDTYRLVRKQRGHWVPEHHNDWFKPELWRPLSKPPALAQQPPAGEK